MVAKKRVSRTEDRISELQFALESIKEAHFAYVQKVVAIEGYLMVMRRDFELLEEKVHKTTNYKYLKTKYDQIISELKIMEAGMFAVIEYQRKTMFRNRVKRFFGIEDNDAKRNEQ